MKKIFIFLATIVSILILLFVLLIKNQSADINSIEIPGQLKGHRLENGQWHMIVASEQNLGFAFGCAQVVDRFFQTELLRMFSTGRLAEWFGESLLNRDRWMRNFSELGKWEWEKLISDPTKYKTVMMVESYIQGRKACANLNPTPIEFKILNISTQEAMNWHPWEVLAIVRGHTSDFSYDSRDEMGRYMLKALNSNEHNQANLPEPQDSYALYNKAKNSAIKKFEGSTRIDLDTSYFPKSVAKADKDFEKKIANKNILIDKWQQFNFFNLGAENGASNSWLFNQDSKKSHLCNDTHLGLMWPSILYPMAYTVENKAENITLKGAGYSLPGLPALNVGEVSIFKNQKLANKIQWGVTIANFVDSQNLIVNFDTKKINSVNQIQTFKVKSKNKTIEELTFNQLWTNIGPRVEDYTDNFSQTDIKLPPMTLFGPIVQKKQSPLEFFIQVTLSANQNLQTHFDLWQFPSVNFSWQEWSQEKNKITVGHKMTGEVYKFTKANNRRQVTDFLSFHDLEKIEISSHKNRPFYLMELIENGSNFIASGNHRIFTDELAHQIAYQWQDNRRALRINEIEKEILKNPESAQYDIKSKELDWFIKFVLKQKLNLCSDKNCLNFLDTLSTFEGSMDKQSNTATAAMLLIKNYKLQYWKENFPTATTELFNWWDKSGHSVRWIENQFIKQDLTYLLAAINQTVTDLKDKQYAWGDVHQVNWLHPLFKATGLAGVIIRDWIYPNKVAVPGNQDSPFVMSFTWNPEEPLNFPATHGPVMRACMTLNSDGESEYLTANVTGVSGNPFSRYATKYAEDYYFSNKLFKLTQ